MTRWMISLLGLFLWLAPPQASPAVVRAVLFYSPQCGHCHYVIQEVLPPLMEKYGAQLEIVGIDVTQPQGNVYFYAALQKFKIQSAGVPLLVIGDEYLGGSVDIPEQLPGLIEKYLAQGGVDYPDISDLRETLAARDEATASQTSPEAPAPQIEDPFALDPNRKVSVSERLARDPLGNLLAIITLIGMLVVAVKGALAFPKIKTKKMTPSGPPWLVPLLGVIGLFVAGYLAYVEVTQVSAVCGPVGDCNTVQQSEYARLFGILPIGVMGLVGYIFILAAWLVGRYGRGPLADYADLFVLGMTAFGLLFSIYLTFLEPFVIGATCAWCLTSAILMTALFWLALKPGRRAYVKLVK